MMAIRALPLIALTLLGLTAEPCGETDPPPQDDDLGYACALDPLVVPSYPFIETRSFKSLPTSNGFVSATYAIDLHGVPVTQLDGTPGTLDPSHRLHTLTEHVMAQPSPDTRTRDLLHDLYLGVKVGGAGTWLSGVAEEEARYVPGTGIIRLLQRVGSVEVETFIFAPFQGESFALVVLGHVRNGGAQAQDVDLFALINAHAGGEGSANGEDVVSTGSGGILESRGGDRLLYQPIEAPSHRGAAPAGAPDNPWVRLTNGQDLTDQLRRGDDVAAGLQWDLGGGSLAPGADAWGGVVIGLDVPRGGAQALVDRLEGFVAGRSSAEVLAAEVAFWDAYHAVESPPDIAGDALRVYRQSTAVLKMGQVREPGPGYGQLLASLPPGGWNISWPRDAAYAIVGLVRSGHLDEARAALSFMIEGDAGRYADALGIGDYLISACRYYGDGTEESDGAFCPDGRDAGPNIELDDFGLFLWAYGAYVNASSDRDFMNATLGTVLAGVADPLVALIEPETDLLVPDSSIWERHWEDCFPNGRKHFTYSDVMAVQGLRVAFDLTGDFRYDDAATRIRGGLLNRETGPAFEVQISGEACPALASAPEERCVGCGPWDGSVIEAINMGVIRPDSALARGTLYGLVRNLGGVGGGPGFLRNDDGTGTTNPYPWYDDQEWVVIDLRMAAAMARMGDAMGDNQLKIYGATLVGWITHLASHNADLIPELLSDGRYTAEDEMDHTNPGQDAGHEYQGSAPMTGFGPGAYILAQEALYGE